MAEFVATAVVFLILGVFLGLAWNSDGDVKLSEPTEDGTRPL